MTNPEPAASRYELDQLARRLDSMDQTGTRGVGRMAEQIAQLYQAFARIEGELAEHEKRHEAEAKARASERRWRIGTTIASFAVLVAILGVLLNLRAGIH